MLIKGYIFVVSWIFTDIFALFKGIHNSLGFWIPRRGFWIPDSLSLELAFRKKN